MCNGYPYQKVKFQKKYEINNSLFEIRGQILGQLFFEIPPVGLRLCWLFFQLYAKQDCSLLFLHIHVFSAQLNKRTFTVLISLLAKTARYCLVQSIYVPTSHSHMPKCVAVTNNLFTPHILRRTRW